MHLRMTRSILLNCTVLHDTYCIELASYCVCVILYYVVSYYVIFELLTLYILVYYNALYTKSWLCAPAYWLSIIAIIALIAIIGVIGIMCKNVTATHFNPL